MIISLSMAKALLEASEKQARAMGLSQSIAIVDEGGNLIAFHRMENAKIASIDIAVNKAWTSVALQVPTANLVNASQPGGDLFGINTTNQGKVIIFGGGIPLTINNRVVGGIGVSGATTTQDIQVADPAIQLFNRITAAHQNTK